MRSISARESGSPARRRRSNSSALDGEEAGAKRTRRERREVVDELGDVVAARGRLRHALDALLEDCNGVVCRLRRGLELRTQLGQLALKLTQRLEQRRLRGLERGDLPSLAAILGAIYGTPAFAFCRRWMNG